MKNKSFVVFLDVDGVHNSKTTVQKTPDGYQGIDDARVELGGYTEEEALALIEEVKPYKGELEKILAKERVILVH